MLHFESTGSAEIVVKAGSSSDPDFIIADILGMTVADVLIKLFERGYAIRHISDHYLVCLTQGYKKEKKFAKLRKKNKR
ncbi:hypothetical protein LSG31_11635 [Fodinisporobacter ferrooxydans]|uniref:Uncharacterized protein n=1 Tax=Fodinisporobacter ferrooxydans TaxID=2901836 RepID=A0ABY4CUC0_9BACL|nr:hypothetical protein LSG31_11635 [Alicyclobacillaceae bacterium MYW30-H2]